MMNSTMTENAGKRPTDAPERTRGGRVYRPLTDIVEREDGLTLMLEMPGVASDDVDVTLEKRVLTIRGEVRPSAPEKLEPVYTEYGEGDFERAFTLSDDFDPDTIEAVMQNGVLTLTLARAEAARPKKISVRSV